MIIIQNIKYKLINEISGLEMDDLLDKGWFRFADLIAKVHFLPMDNEIQEVLNIRYPLQNFLLKKSHRRIWNRVENNFRIEFSPAYIDEQKEELYENFKNRMYGIKCLTLNDFLFGENDSLPYDTQELSVYDGGRLIAYSYFDLGINSIASLLCIYDESYRQFSLGNYTMLKEIEYAINLGMDYYYPGYILRTNDLFGYKQNLGNVQYLKEDNWVNSKEEITGDKKFLTLLAKNQEIENYLKTSNIYYKRFLNPYFLYGYITELPDALLKSITPYFLSYLEDEQIVLEYDMEENVFVVSKVITDDFYTFIKDVADCTYYCDETVYLQNIYMYEERILESDSLENLLNYVLD